MGEYVWESEGECVGERVRERASGEERVCGRECGRERVCVGESGSEGERVWEIVCVGEW